MLLIDLALTIEVNNTIANLENRCGSFLCPNNATCVTRMNSTEPECACLGTYLDLRLVSLINFLLVLSNTNILQCIVYMTRFEFLF